MKLLTFTGTRAGMSRRQKAVVRCWLEAMEPTHIAHGGCVGADWDLHVLALLHRQEGFEVRIDVHPSDVRNTYPKGVEKLLQTLGCPPPPSPYDPNPNPDADQYRELVCSAWLELGADHAAAAERPIPRDRRMVDKLVRYDDLTLSERCLFATPRSNRGEEMRSGTWTTVRYARKLGVPIVIVRPNGTHTIEPGRWPLKDHLA